MILFQDIELREALIMAYQMMRFLEDLRYVILLGDQMGMFMSNLGKFHW